MRPPTDPAKAELLAAILPHVPFDGWSAAAFATAVTQTGLPADHARTLCPRGAVDLAVAYHHEGDRLMEAALRRADLSGMKFREKVAFAIRARLAAISDKEAVRRGTALFALPHHAADGAKLIWGTADAIWEALDDTSRDVNWYTKRATLSAVYGASMLFWLGDDSVGGQATDAFVDRRIGNVMAFETAKAKVNDSAVLKPFLAPLNGLLGMIKAPPKVPPMDMPGHWSTDR